MTAIFFNLLANSTFSLICGLIVVGLFVWIFRVRTDGSKLFLLSLPFVKIIYDLIRGIPRDSVLFSGLDPFTLPGGNQTFSVGAGFSDWSFFMNAVFTVKDLAGAKYPASAGDYMLIWTQRKLGTDAPVIIVSSVIAVSTFLVIRRLVQGIRFELTRRADRQMSRLLRVHELGLHKGSRKVDIYKSAFFAGSPFTGGVLRPYICLPALTEEALSPEENTAVIAHELGHIRHFDLVTTIAIQTLGDIFWFVPGYRWLSRKIDRLREVLADQSAVASGVDPAHLASALIKLKEIPENVQQPILHSAFFRERSLLKERIERLTNLRKDSSPRLGWQYKWLRLAFCLSAIGAVINSTFGGNRETLLFEVPAWFSNLMRMIGH